MEDLNLFSNIMSCLDDYMLLKGKKEINDMEANVELERVGLLEDSASVPGKPLRLLLRKLRDTNLLPQNIIEHCGSWSIKLSKTIAQKPTVEQFQYC